jgi:hypothetical protein
LLCSYLNWTDLSILFFTVYCMKLYIPIAVVPYQFKIFVACVAMLYPVVC